MGSALYFSTSFHPQTDGQTERVNALLELYLRHFVSVNQRDWVKLLDIAQFSYNLQRSEATNRSPFEMIMGQQPLTPHTVEKVYNGKSPAAFKVAKTWHEQADIARSYLSKATKKMKKWADSKRRHVEFSVGDMVFVKILAGQHKSTRSLHKGLLRKYEGPFPIVKRVGNVAYQLGLPSRLNFHPVFHVSCLKPYHADMEDPDRNEPKRVPFGATSAYDKDIEAILDTRVVRRQNSNPSRESLVKWKGLADCETSWEPEHALWQFESKIREFHDATSR